MEDQAGGEGGRGWGGGVGIDAGQVVGMDVCVVVYSYDGDCTMGCVWDFFGPESGNKGGEEMGGERQRRKGMEGVIEKEGEENKYFNDVFSYIDRSVIESKQMT